MCSRLASILAVTALCSFACTGVVDAKMVADNLFGHRNRKVGNATYPVPKPSVSSQLDLDEDSYAVHGLPNMSTGAFATKHWAGDVPIPYAGEDDYGRIFFWLFEPSDGKAEDKPLIIWLNGGPGCSSMMGLFLENGPFRVQPNGSIGINPYSWHREGYVLYIDQPLG